MVMQRKIIVLSCLAPIAGVASCGGGGSGPDDAGVDMDVVVDLVGDTEGDSGVDPDAPADTVVDGDIDPGGEFVDVLLTSAITHVQPMTGIVLWNDHESSGTGAIQLEYSYMAFDDVAVVENPSDWDWSGVESLLDEVAGHGHQAILRFYYVYPGSPTTVPGYIKALSGYDETSGYSEGEFTWYPDWSSVALQDFTKDFYTEFAARHDDDPRMAFLQVGFGLWGEYHLYDPGEELGVNFPSKAYQTEFFQHLASVFDELRWSISIDAADDSNTPFADTPALGDLVFGLFDDSFLSEDHDGYNDDCFDFFGAARRLTSPVGGEISYYTDWDQRHALDLPDGPHGTSYEAMAARYNVSYMIGNDQPDYQSMDRIEQAGIASGYSFRVIAFSAAPFASKVTVLNEGIAPIYTDAFVTVNGVRATESLAILMPGDSHEYWVGSGGTGPTLSIECDRLVAGQEIQFAASL